MMPAKKNFAAESSPPAGAPPLKIDSKRPVGRPGPDDAARYRAEVERLMAAAANRAQAQAKPTRAPAPQSPAEPPPDAVAQQSEFERLFPAGSEDNILGELTVRQLRAVELIVTGRGDHEVAAELHVHRITVSRWRMYHVGFKAALSRRRQELWGTSADRFRNLLARAVDVVEEGLFSDDPRDQVRAARAVLGLASRGRFGPPQDPDDSPGILDRLAREHRQQRVSRDEAEQPLEAEDYSEAVMELGRRHSIFREKEERPELAELPQVPPAGLAARRGDRGIALPGDVSEVAKGEETRGRSPAPPRTLPGSDAGAA